MHLVQFSFKLKSELHFFFVVLCVLSVLLLQFQPHLPLVHSFFFERFRVLLEYLHILLNDLLIISLLLESGLILSFQLLNFLFVFLTNFLDEHSVVCAAAVFEKD